MSFVCLSMPLVLTAGASSQGSRATAAVEYGKDTVLAPGAEIREVDERGDERLVKLLTALLDVAQISEISAVVPMPTI